MNAVQNAITGEWHCGSCQGRHADQQSADECCGAAAIGDDQEAFSLEEIDEEA